MFGFHIKSPQEEPQPDFASLVPEHPATPPAWSGELDQHYSAKKRRVIPDAAAKRIWASRPLLKAAEFAHYWPTAREAETAWKVLHLAELNFGRPTLPMAYPNDPMGLYAAWSGDSMDDVEYIMLLEKEFGVTIPDGDAEKIFLDFTLRETVQYLLSKQNRASHGK